ncbi:MAG: GDP-mannose 4,6-dehydratase [Bacillaceae bacterium]|nr:GDP-mannose 4,6-dehydratase [Bacillaceae bacterium]
MTKAKKILITGANGFTGQHACEYFSSIGMNVIAMVRKIPSNSETNWLYEKCDITNKQELSNLMTKVYPDYVLHLAGRNAVPESWKEPVNYIEVNTLSTMYLLESIRTVNPMCRTIVVGSALQYDPAKEQPDHPYSLSKTLQSTIAKTWSHLFKQDIIIAKPSNLIGPGPSNGVCSIFAKRVIDRVNHQLEPKLKVADLSQARDFLDVRDAVKAYGVIFEQGEKGKTYDIGSGVIRTLNDVVSVLQTQMNIRIHVDSFTPYKPQQLRTKTYSAMDKLGWKPTIPFEKSITDIINYYRQ